VCGNDKGQVGVWKKRNKYLKKIYIILRWGLMHSDFSRKD
jgi:hypothetical protein